MVIVVQRVPRGEGHGPSLGFGVLLSRVREVTLSEGGSEEARGGLV